MKLLKQKVMERTGNKKKKDCVLMIFLASVVAVACHFFPNHFYNLLSDGSPGAFSHEKLLLL